MKRIFRIVPASARRLIPTTAATVNRFRLTTAARPTGQIVPPSVRWLTRITVRIELRLLAHMAALRISATVRQSVKAAIPTTVATEQRSAPLMGASSIMRIAVQSVR